MKVVFSEFAEQELHDAVYYYEQEHAVLSVAHQHRKPEYWIDHQ